MTTKRVWLPDRHTHGRTDRRQTKWSLCAAMLRRQHENRQTDRQTPDKVIPMCRYASQATQILFLQDLRFQQNLSNVPPLCSVYAMHFVHMLELAWFIAAKIFHSVALLKFSYMVTGINNFFYLSSVRVTMGITSECTQNLDFPIWSIIYIPMKHSTK